MPVDLIASAFCWRLKSDADYFGACVGAIGAVAAPDESGVIGLEVALLGVDEGADDERGDIESQAVSATRQVREISHLVM